MKLNYFNLSTKKTYLSFLERNKFEKIKKSEIKKLQKFVIK